MRGLVVEKGGDIRIADDIPMPQIGPYDALVKTECCMICNGTDMEIIRGELPEAQDFPLVLGHESSGKIIDTGEKVCTYKKGDRVIRSALPDSGRYYSAWGGFAEYGIVTDAVAMRRDGIECRQGLTQQVVPEGISAVQASLMITLKETCSALDRIGVRKDDRVLVVGDGPVGLCFLSGLKMLGITDVSVLGNRRSSLERAGGIGAKTYWNHDDREKAELKERIGGSVTVYIDPIGSRETISQGMEFLAEDGRIAVYGLRTGERLDLCLKGMRNFSLQFVQWPLEYKEMLVHDRVAAGILEKQIDTELLISHILPFEKYKEGFAAIAEKRALKVALTFGD